jgi:hypothetical protein
LHAKVIVCGETAVIGSANLSSSGLIEASLLTDDPAAVSQATAFIDQLRRRAKLVDQKFLDHIAAIEVTRRPEQSRRTGQPVHPTGGRCWIVGVHEITKPPRTDEADLISRGEKRARRLSRRRDHTWIRFTGTSRFRGLADAGDMVWQIWLAADRKRPVVLRHSSVVYRQDEPACTRLFLAERPDSEAAALSFKVFQEIAKRAGITGKLGRSTTREIPQETAAQLWQLWPKT